jgi:hypothetical protein
MRRGTCSSPTGVASACSGPVGTTNTRQHTERGVGKGTGRSMAAATDVPMPPCAGFAPPMPMRQGSGFFESGERATTEVRKLKPTPTAAATRRPSARTPAATASPQSSRASARCRRSRRVCRQSTRRAGRTTKRQSCQRRRPWCCTGAAASIRRRWASAGVTRRLRGLPPFRSSAPSRRTSTEDNVAGPLAIYGACAAGARASFCPPPPAV